MNLSTVFSQFNYKLSPKSANYYNFFLANSLKSDNRFQISILGPELRINFQDMNSLQYILVFLFKKKEGKNEPDVSLDNII